MRRRSRPAAEAGRSDRSGRCAGAPLAPSWRQYEAGKVPAFTYNLGPAQRFVVSLDPSGPQLPTPGPPLSADGDLAGCTAKRPVFGHPPRSAVVDALPGRFVRVALGLHPQPVAERAGELALAQAIGLGLGHTCMRLSASDVRCWGNKLARTARRCHDDLAADASEGCASLTVAPRRAITRRRSRSRARSSPRFGRRGSETRSGDVLFACHCHGLAGASQEWRFPSLPPCGSSIDLS